MLRPTLLVQALFAATVIAAFALWPAFISRRSDASAVNAASLPTMAPITRDYLDRPRYIAFWERAVREHHVGDMMSPRQLADQYLQRYRENGDIGDVLRAEAMAKLSLERQPYQNLPAEASLASVDLTLHRFKDALAITRHIESYDPRDEQMMIREASLDLELGRYGDAKRIIATLPPRQSNFDLGRDTLLTRYDELTGHLADARRLFARPTALANSVFDAPAQSRAWFFFRSGELAFESGDNDAAIADEAQALNVFPRDVDASRAKARFECAVHRWSDCLSDATFSAAIVPYPETLGYEADAQRALGDAAAAERTNDLIRVVERIGNAQHISDRLLAIYYSEHRLYPDDALAIAKRELGVRDDVFTEDTLAWAAAMDGQWTLARSAIAKAVRLNTQDARMQYHAGVIALHFGDRAEARRRFEAALALNPQFHPVYADDARTQLARL